MTRIALVREVFHLDTDGALLRECLAEAKDLGASIAVLPEIPMNPWAPATRTPSDDDAEPAGGPRAARQAEAARSVGIGLVGGIIERLPDGQRRNQAMVFGSDGGVLGRYAKCHIPDEPGFYEAHHYGPGEEYARPIHGLDVPIGVQICSDANRPEGTHLLAALGAEVVVVPRSTLRETWSRWRPVLISSALTSCCYTATVNRPSSEQGVEIGGPSFAVAPDGTVLVESEDRVSVFDVDRDAMPRFRKEYPGYIAVRSDLYAKGWKTVKPS